VVWNGYLPEWRILTGLGEVEVRVPKVRDRERQRAELVEEQREG